MNTAVKGTGATLNAGKMFFCNINVEGNMPTPAVFNHITSMRMVVAMWCNGTLLQLFTSPHMFIITEQWYSVAALEQLINETVWVLWSQLSSVKSDHLIFVILWSRPQSSMMGDYTTVTISVWSIISVLVKFTHDDSTGQWECQVWSFIKRHLK